MAASRYQMSEDAVREFDLLVFLMRNPGRVFRRAELLEQVWGWTFGDQSTVTVHMRRLREKVEDNPAEPRRIVTVLTCAAKRASAKAMPASSHASRRIVSMCRNRCRISSSRTQKRAR